LERNSLKLIHGDHPPADPRQRDWIIQLGDIVVVRMCRWRRCWLWD